MNKLIARLRTTAPLVRGISADERQSVYFYVCVRPGMALRFAGSMEK